MEGPGRSQYQKAYREDGRVLIEMPGSLGWLTLSIILVFVGLRPDVRSNVVATYRIASSRI